MFKVLAAERGWDLDPRVWLFLPNGIPDFSRLSSAHLSLTPRSHQAGRAWRENAHTSCAVSFMCCPHTSFLGPKLGFLGETLIGAGWEGPLVQPAWPERLGPIHLGLGPWKVPEKGTGWRCDSEVPAEPCLKCTPLLLTAPRTPPSSCSCLREPSV